MSTTLARPHQHTDRSVRAAVKPKAVGAFAYGVVSYGVGVAALLGVIATTLGLFAFPAAPLAFETPAAAAAFNLALLVAFALQHSVMARKAFKARWTRIIRPSMERATYVLATGLVLLPLLALWQPIAGSLWQVDAPALRVALKAIAALGWAYLFVASFAIDHFELFGLQQVWRDMRGLPPKTAPFQVRWMYRFDRHPIMTGLAIGLWVTPDMTATRFAFALGMSLYAMVGVHFEERALRREWGEAYETYRRRVGTIVPLPFAD